jgi:membrane protease YdiL (CAAX protease family)
MDVAQRVRSVPANLSGVDRVQVVSRRTLGNEVLLVLGVGLGASGIYALLDILRRLSVAQPLSQQSSNIVVSQAANHWLDLAYQLVDIGLGLVPALLAAHLLNRTGDAAVALGLAPRRTGFDLGTGAGLFALIGVPGLGLYLAARHLGLNTTVVPTSLPHVWWGVPVLLLSALQNGILEEVVVVGYLMTRLRELGWSLPAVVATSALLRGSYHLYQGFGGFVGNAVMGVIFALFFARYRRVGPLIFAHFLLDAVAFVGYATVGRHLSFLH